MLASGRHCFVQLVPWASLPHLEQCLAHSRSSVGICWINKWKKEHAGLCKGYTNYDTFNNLCQNCENLPDFKLLSRSWKSFSMYWNYTCIISSTISHVWTDCGKMFRVHLSSQASGRWVSCEAGINQCIEKKYPKLTARTYGVMRFDNRRDYFNLGPPWKIQETSLPNSQAEGSEL